jgi:hypothetical protein
MNEDRDRRMNAPREPEASSEDLHGTDDLERGEVGLPRGPSPAAGEREWRDGSGAYGISGSREFRGWAGPRSGYGVQGFGAGETPGARWGGGRRGGYGGGDPGRDYAAFEAPWTQSEFGGRGEFGDRYRRGTWGGGTGYSAGADPGPAMARGERWTVPGPHSGRGPENYRRSETAIRDDVCERLTRHGHLDASRISVQVENGEVILEGLVDSRHAKRMAEDAAETVSGVRDVHNRLRIQASEYDRDRPEGRSDR